MWGDINHSNETIAKSDAALVLPPDLPKAEENTPVTLKTPTEGSTANFVLEPKVTKTEQQPILPNEKIVNADLAMETIIAMSKAAEFRIAKLTAEKEMILQKKKELDEEEKKILETLELAKSISVALDQNLEQLKAIDASVTAALNKN